MRNCRTRYLLDCPVRLLVAGRQTTLRWGALRLPAGEQSGPRCTAGFSWPDLSHRLGWLRLRAAGCQTAMRWGALRLPAGMQSGFRWAAMPSQILTQSSRG